MAGRDERSRSKKASEQAADGSLRVWAEVGITIALTNDPPQFLRTLVGHERMTQGSSLKALKSAVADVQEFNEQWLQKHVKKARRIALSSMAEADEEEEESRLSTKERARRRAGRRR